MKAILQLHHEYLWEDALSVSEITGANKHPQFSCAYLSSYLANHIGTNQYSGTHSASVNAPLSWDSQYYSQTPAYLLDIMPSGASSRFLSLLLDNKQPRSIFNAIAPIGNLRIKQQDNHSSCLDFSHQEISDHGPAFAHHAHALGADIRSGLGAGGEAPKYLLAESTNGRFYLDNDIPDHDVAKHWLVKFPRNRGTAIDKEILKSEYCYYKCLSLLGFNSVATDDMHLSDGQQPGLWLRRFDRHVSPEGVKRQSVESIYSVMNNDQPGSYLNHFDVLEKLVSLWKSYKQDEDVQSLITEYLVRDLIKQVLGDSDNHGRNMAIIRDTNKLRLAPMFDIAPMVMDSEGIVRLTKWPKEMEYGSSRWEEICNQCEKKFGQPELFACFRERAKPLLDMPDALFDAKAPEYLFKHPQVHIHNMKTNFKKWKLI